MNDINNILSEIRRQCAEEEKEILARGDAEAEKILAAKKAESEAECEEILRSAAKKAAMIRENADAASESAAKCAVLSAKNESVSAMLEKYAKKLSELPDEEYFSKIVSLVRKHADPAKKGEILLAAGDAGRDAGVFCALLEKAGLSGLSVSGKYAKGAAGCVIVYGKIEENLIIEEVLTEKKDILRDEIVKLVFGEENE